MKTSRDVYQKLREVKYHHLIKLYKKFLKKIPDNCRYNYPYKFSSDNNEIELRLCLLHQPDLDLKSGIYPHLVDVCQEPAHCMNCNAFVLRHTKETVKEMFETELKDQKIKQEKYPDICALEWVMEQSAVSIPLFSWVQRFFYQIKKLILK